MHCVGSKVQSTDVAVAVAVMLLYRSFIKSAVEKVNWARRCQARNSHWARDEILTFCFCTGSSQVEFLEQGLQPQTDP